MTPQPESVESCAASAGGAGEVSDSWVAMERPAVAVTSVQLRAAFIPIALAVPSSDLGKPFVSSDTLRSCQEILCDAATLL